MEFVKLDVESDAQTLADDAVGRLRSEWDGWEPNDADLEVVMVEAVAPMAQNAAEVAARMGEETFRSYGQKLIGLPYSPGTPAVASVDFVLTDNLGHTIQADTEVDIDGYAFRTIDPVTVPNGSTTALDVGVESTETGSVQNGLTGETVALITAVPWVSETTINTPPSGGADPESDSDYLNHLSRRLRLQAATLVTLQDYELLALEDPGVMRVIALRDTNRNVRVVGIGYDGLPLATEVKDRLELLYGDYREINSTVTLEDATYTEIDVTYTVKSYTGSVDPVDLEARIDAALSEWLSPSVFGSTRTFGESSGGWVNENIIRRNKLIDIISDVDGVNYVDTLTLNGSAGSLEPDGDWAMPGDVSLPTVGTLSGTVT